MWVAPVGILLAQLARELEQPCGRAGLYAPRAGHERLEAAGPIGPDPAIERLA